MGEGTRSWPHLKGKAKNLVIVSHWLASFIEQKCLDGPVRDLSWAFSRVSVIISNASDLLTQGERMELHACCLRVCDSWTVLSNEAAAPGKPRWQMTVKNHVWFHILMRAVITGRNPKHFWCYVDEASMKDLKDVASKSHPNLMCLRSLESRYAMLGLAVEDRHQFTPIDSLVDM